MIIYSSLILPIKAYDNLDRPDKYAAMAVDARQELDLKIGVAFSRLMTRAYLDQVIKGSVLTCSAWPELSD